MCRQPATSAACQLHTLTAFLITLKGMPAAHPASKLWACLLRAALRRVGDGHDVAPAARVGRPGGDQRARAAAAAPVVRVAQDPSQTLSGHTRKSLRVSSGTNSASIYQRHGYQIGVSSRFCLLI